MILEGLPIAEDGHLIVHDGVHVGAEGLHILADEDLVLLGLILVGIKTSGEVLYLVLWSSRRTDRVLLPGWLWWWWWLGGRLPDLTLSSYGEPKPRMIRSQLILIGGLISRVVHLL